MYEPQNCILFSSNRPFTLSFDTILDTHERPRLEYSHNQKDWHLWTSFAEGMCDAIPSENNVLFVRGKANTALNGRFIFNPDLQLRVECYGNIMTLLDWENPEVKMGELAFANLFLLCDCLTKGPDLPATELSDWCYAHLFSGCKNLEVAPALPREVKLAPEALRDMFEGTLFQKKLMEKIIA